MRDVRSPLALIFHSINHSLAQLKDSVKIFLCVKNRAALVWKQSIFPKPWELQITDGKKVAANLRMYVGELIMDNAAVINQKVSSADYMLLIPDKILAFAAVNNADLHMISVGVKETWIAADFWRDFSHVAESWLGFRVKTQRRMLFYKMLNHKFLYMKNHSREIRQEVPGHFSRKSAPSLHLPAEGYEAQTLLLPGLSTEYPCRTVSGVPHDF